MSSTKPNIISAILLELQVGVLSTSTAMDSILCSWQTTLSPEHRAQWAGGLARSHPAGRRPPHGLQGLEKHTLGQGELLKPSACLKLAISPTWIPLPDHTIWTSQNLGVSCKSKLLLNSKIETYNLKALENCKDQLTYNFSILQMKKQVQND